MDSEFLRGRKKAMALLNHKDRTRWELQDKMANAGFSDEVIEDAIAYVESFHYIDDLRYARRFVEIYRESRSIMRMKQDLKKRHVPEDYIEIAFEEINYDDTAALRRAVGKLCKNVEELSYDDKQKIASKLYRKGFKTDQIFKQLEKW